MVDALALGVCSAGGRRGAHVEALAVDAGVRRRAVALGAAARLAAAHRADLAARAVRVLAAHRDAHAIAAALVHQTLRIGRAQRAAHGVFAREARGAALGTGARCRFANTCL